MPRRHYVYKSDAPCEHPKERRYFPGKHGLGIEAKDPMGDLYCPGCKLRWVACQARGANRDRFWMVAVTDRDVILVPLVWFSLEISDKELATTTLIPKPIPKPPSPPTKGRPPPRPAYVSKIKRRQDRLQDRSRPLPGAR